MKAAQRKIAKEIEQYIQKEGLAEEVYYETCSDPNRTEVDLPDGLNDRQILKIMELANSDPKIKPDFLMLLSLSDKDVIQIMEAVVNIRNYLEGIGAKASEETSGDKGPVDLNLVDWLDIEKSKELVRVAANTAASALFTMSIGLEMK